MKTEAIGPRSWRETAPRRGRRHTGSGGRCGRAQVLDCALSLMASVSQAVAEFKRRHDRLDVLVNDAAVFLSGRDVTSEGHERMLATNYLGPFLLTISCSTDSRPGAPRASSL